MPLVFQIRNSGDGALESAFFPIQEIAFVFRLEMYCTMGDSETKQSLDQTGKTAG